MKYYIASGLDNADNVRILRDLLNNIGWTQTYDWTVHGSVAANGSDALQIAAVAESDAVNESEVVIVVLPGLKGTHTELGLGLNAPRQPLIVVYGSDELHFCNDNRTCAFYYHPRVRRISWENTPLNKLPQAILDLKVSQRLRLRDLDVSDLDEDSPKARRASRTFGRRRTLGHRPRQQ